MRRPTVSAARARVVEATRTPSVEDQSMSIVPSALSLRDPGSGKRRELNIAKLAGVPNMAAPLAQSLIRYSKLPTVNSYESVRTFYGTLSGGFIAYLIETNRSHLALGEIDRSVLSAFIGWLDLTDEGVATMKDGTKLRYYECALQALNLLRKDSNLSERIVAPDEIPRAPWKKRERSSMSMTNDLLEHELRAIFVAAAKEVRAITATVICDLTKSAPPEADLAERHEVISLVRQLVSKGIGTWSSINRLDRRLATRIDRLGREGVMRSARPESLDLIPFILLFTIAFRLNGSVLLAAKRSDFDVRPWIGGKRIFARPYKPRAKRRQVASAAVANEAINPVQMLELLDLWLEPLRSISGGSTLFHYWNPKTVTGARGIDTRAKPSDEFLINEALQRFVSNIDPAARGGIDPEKVTLARVRKAVLDLAHTVSKGDLIKVKAAASHSSIQTTGEHYVTAAGMAREDEALARAMNSQVTMVATRANFDPRRLADEATEACTPGWSCLRGSSPAFGRQRTDGQCISYGRCPVCIHGRTDFTSAKACARVHLLVDAIERAIENMPPAAWLSQLAPIRMHLIERVLPAFPSKIHQQASALDLPTMPSPE